MAPDSRLVAFGSISVATNGQQQTKGRAVNQTLLEGEVMTCVAASIGELVLAQRRWL